MFGAGRQKRQRGHSGDIRAPADRKPVSCGNPDADSGEAAGTDTNQDAVGLPPVEKLVEHRHQPLTMAAPDQLVALSQTSSIGAK